MLDFLRPNEPKGDFDLVEPRLDLKAEEDKERIR